MPERLNRRRAYRQPMPASGRTRPGYGAAKVRRYTGRRCICPGAGYRRAPDGSQGRSAPPDNRAGAPRPGAKRIGTAGRTRGSAPFAPGAAAADLAGGLATGRTRTQGNGPWSCPTGSPARLAPRHPGSASHGKGTALRSQEPNGALKGATDFETTSRRQLAAPRPINHRPPRHRDGDMTKIKPRAGPAA